MVLNSGATAPTLFIDGGTVTANVNEPLAALASTPGWNASAVLINAGATVDTINNGGTLTSTIQGVNSTAYAIRDLSGSVTTINNTRIIQAAVLALQNGSTTVVTDPALLGPKLYAVAIDVSANTTGVTLNQTGVVDVTGAGVTTLDTDGDGVYDTHEPLVFGQVRFGTGNDTFNIQNGSVYGNLYFNTGNDALVIGGANSATVAGTISHGATGNFDVTVNNGTLTLGNIGADTAATAYQPATTGGLITGRNLVVGAAGQLVFTANPTIVGQQNGEFSVQTANLATGAKIGMQLTKLITNFTDSDSNGVVDNAVFTVIHTATPGGLTVGAGIDGGLVGGNTPFLYKSSVKVDAAAGNVDVVLTLRNTTELGLNAEGATIFNSFYTALGGDSGVTSAILAQTTQKDFLGLYNQFLPNQGQGIFSALDMTSRAVGRVIADKPDRVQRYGPDSVWVQEINADVMRDAGVGLGSNTKAFGFVGGYESMGDDGGALGATLAYVSAEESDKDAQVGEQTSVSVVEASVYWRRAMGNFLFSARGAGGYVWFDGDRRFVFPSASTTTSVLREYDSGWTGYTLAANASAAYETTFGRFYLRPQINLDYFYLNEGSYSETGGSNSALALDISGRTSNRLSASAELAFGATFGRDFWWRPEIRVGYRETISSNLGELNAQFQGGGSPFLIQPDDTNGGAAIIAMALKAGTAMSYVAVEGELEALDSETRYNLRLEGRMMF